MSVLYATLWLITSTYAAPLGFYSSTDACTAAAHEIHVPSAHVLCVPSDAARPLSLNYDSVPAEGTAATPKVTTPAPSAAETVAVDSAKVSTEGIPFVGSANAPVTMAYWYDYQCPFCRQLEETVMGRLMTDYVQPGKLKILFKNDTFLGPDSLTAALASDAVWESAPAEFYQWHKAMFDAQGPENSGWATKDKIIALTRTIPGIDAAKVEQLMTDHAAQYQEQIDAAAAEGDSMGIDGTPGAIIGKQSIAGAEDYQVFKADIDAALGVK